MPKREHKISPAELDVLQVLWAERDISLRDIHLALESKHAYTTVQTLLDRLVGKELVRRDRTKRPATHRATVTRRRVVAQYVDWLVEKVADGPAPLVMQLLKGNQFSASELQTMRQLIEQAENDNK